MNSIDKFEMTTQIIVKKTADKRKKRKTSELVQN